MVEETRQIFESSPDRIDSLWITIDRYRSLNANARMAFAFLGRINIQHIIEPTKSTTPAVQETCSQRSFQ
jgi:hypothetical protein